jgi:hypothetical protein
MKRKVRKEPEGGNKKRKEVGNDNSEAQVETVRRSENDTNDIQGTHTEHATVPKRCLDPKCISI